jgi:uncharacterized repeat protein (TIGR03803 family)
MGKSQLSALLFILLLISTAQIAAHAQSFSVVYNFGTNSGDPYQPTYSGIIAQGRDGNLYSTAPFGGTNNLGAIFKISPAGALTVLYSFAGSDGQNPASGLTLGTDGNFYGTTFVGGTLGYGTVFKITPSDDLIVLYNFTNGEDGAYPLAPPVEGVDGNFYGTTCGGVVCYNGGSLGTIYKITTSGKLTSLYQFDNTHGYDPVAPLVLGADGSFYGTAEYGGTGGHGVVFKLTPAKIGKVKYKVLYNFDRRHGQSPAGPLVQATDGNFYGTTVAGGKTATGQGEIFKITSQGGLTVLYSLDGSQSGGPFAGLVQATDGNFYGANRYGGKGSNCGDNGCGATFQISPKRQFLILHNFDLATGSAPYVTPFQHTNGTIYGDTQEGGTGDVGCAAGTCGVFYSWSAGLPAFVSLLPYAGKVGKTVEFLGQGFTGTTAVTFNGTPANFKVASDTYLTATVPAGATTGFVTVTTPGGSLKSNKKFRVESSVHSLTF